MFVFDGQRFSNLGPMQGLPEGGVVRDVAFDGSGRVVLRYINQVFVSRQAPGGGLPPQRLGFIRADDGKRPLFNAAHRQLAVWAGGAVVIDAGTLRAIDPGVASPSRSTGAARLPTVPRDLDGHIVSVSGDGPTLWAGSEDGRICALATRAAQCFGAADGLPAEQWTAFLALADGRLLARSLRHLATIDADRRHLAVEALPDQESGPYSYYKADLELVLAPSGDLVTQASAGPIARRGGVWRPLAGASGLPHAPIVSLLFTPDGNLWLAADGVGVVSTLGLGRWENWSRPDGLSDDVIWQMAREPGGGLWVANGWGVDRIGGAGGRAAIDRHLRSPAYAVATDGRHYVWRSDGTDGLARTDLLTGRTERYQVPSVNRILHGRSGQLWLLTEHGLYAIEDASRPAAAPVLVDGSLGEIESGAVGPDGSLWLLSGYRLAHRRADGTTAIVVREWRDPHFVPAAVAVGRDGVVWVGGAPDGLCRLRQDGDRVLENACFGPPRLPSATVYSVLVDRRGWLFVGTDRGLAVTDGQRWSGADRNSGLIGNDIDQDALFEDADGSVWIGTTGGLSHLLDPASLFRRQGIRPVIDDVRVGDTVFAGRALPYSRDALTIAFGAIGAGGDIRFRYRLDGIDTGWTETGGGAVRYPSMPFGDHRFSVIAYDPLTHEQSAATSIVLRMRRPWYRRWPVEAAAAAAVAAAIRGLLRVRYRYLLAQQRRLQREVERRTHDLLVAQQALILQATQDSLTGLLTRGEIQRRLIDILTVEFQTPSLSVGLIDIDRFKTINDRYGHLAGDDILAELGRRLRDAFQPGEQAGRYGGEEILIVVRAGGPAGVQRIAALMAAAVGEPFPAGLDRLTVTCSAGVAQGRRKDEWRSLMGRADAALYRAKAAGRNRLVEADADEELTPATVLDAL